MPDDSDGVAGRVRQYAWAGILAFCVAVGVYAAVRDPGTGTAGSYGALSILPAVATLVICFVTRNVILALFMGIVVGGLISTDYNIIQAYLIPNIGTPRFAEILLVYLWALGGLLGLWNRNGGAWHFATFVSSRFVHSRRSAMFFAWALGMLFHQGGTVSTVLTGTTVRPVADREKVAHEELSYIVDSTASPVATIIPFNAWPLYVGGLIAIPSLAAQIPDRDAAVALFIQSLPYNFYAWIAVALTLLFALGWLPFVGGPMRRAQERVLATGALDAPGAEPMISRELTTVDVAPGYHPSLLDFFVPIGVLLAVAILPYLVAGQLMIFEAFGLALVAAVLLSLLRGMSTKDAFDGLVDGVKGVTVGAIILGLAVTLGGVSESLGAADWVIATTAGGLTSIPWVLPGLLTLLCMAISFSVGTSWGTYAVVFPIALPLAFAIAPDPLYVSLCFGAIMGGSVFGDQCSPISDTTILSALSCGADLMDHVVTQLPLALAAAGAAILLCTAIALGIA